MEAKTKETNVKLISRSGTLFSIIDGKEIVCKDQEQARKLVLTTDHLSTLQNIIAFKAELKDDVIYSVHCYTVRVEDGCKIICRNGNAKDCDKSGCQNPVSILSLEAPEKDIVGGQLNIPKDKNETATYVVGPEQPAQPVDKLEVFKSIEDLRPYLLSHPDKDMVRSSCLHYLGDKFQAFDVSPSPERGESDGRVEVVICPKCEGEGIINSFGTTTSCKRVCPCCAGKKFVPKFLILPKPPKQ